MCAAAHSAALGQDSHLDGIVQKAMLSSILLLRCIVNEAFSWRPCSSVTRRVELLHTIRSSCHASSGFALTGEPPQ